MCIRDSYDMIQLNRHTDRILPNGCCLLSPRQTCGKGNACLTCDKFVTDVTFLPELTTQQARTAQLIDERRAAFTARTGQQMSAARRSSMSCAVRACWVVSSGRKVTSVTNLSQVRQALPLPQVWRGDSRQQPLGRIRSVCLFSWIMS